MDREVRVSKEREGERERTSPTIETPRSLMNQGRFFVITDISTSASNLPIFLSSSVLTRVFGSEIPVQC